MGSKTLTKQEFGLNLYSPGLSTGPDLNETKAKIYHRIAYKKSITDSIKPKTKSNSTKFKH